MSQEDNDIELIEAFHKNLLSKADLAEFQKRQAEDTEFALKVDDYRLIMSEINTLGEEDFALKMKHWEQEISARYARQITLRRYWMTAAIIIIMLFPLAYWLISDQTQLSHEELYAQYYSPFGDVISERSGSGRIMTDAMNAYNLGDYEQAVDLLTEIIDQNADQTLAANCYKAIAMMALGKYDESKPILISITRSDKGLYREVSQWYLALLYLKLDDRDDLDKALHEITSIEDHMFAQQARSLQQQLDQ